jgi:hypothetical protein
MNDDDKDVETAKRLWWPTKLFDAAGALAK